jgi:hypothetical protein
LPVPPKFRPHYIPRLLIYLSIREFVLISQKPMVQEQLFLSKPGAKTTVWIVAYITVQA